jgi:hypothetical protein
MDYRYNIPSNGGTYLHGNSPQITTLVANYLEKKNPGSSSNIKMSNVNSLYNRIKSGVSGNSGNNFSLNKINHIPNLRKFK